MSSHDNSDLKKHIDDNGTLLTKMHELTQQLQTQLYADFQSTMGIPLPSAAEADVREVEYSMVYSSDPITSEYMSGAKTLLDGVFSQNWPDVANKALDVVQVLIGNIVGSASIQTGGSSKSMKILATKDHPAIISAAFTEVQECSGRDWLTQTNFYVAYYAFVVWAPSEAHLEAIVRANPEID